MDREDRGRPRGESGLDAAVVAVADLGSCEVRWLSLHLDLDSCIITFTSRVCMGIIIDIFTSRMLSLTERSSQP